MRLLTLLLCLAVALVAATSSSGAPTLPFKATLAADGHSPKGKSTWRYHVRVTDLKGHPIAAKISSFIVDPLGTKHPVEFDGTGHNAFVKNYAFFGNFCDSITWPVGSGLGVTLEFETAIVTAKGRTTLVYPVAPTS